MIPEEHLVAMPPPAARSEKRARLWGEIGRPQANEKYVVNRGRLSSAEDGREGATDGGTLAFAQSSSALPKDPALPLASTTRLGPTGGRE